jgi:two-component system, sensor histidine kinase and response regulator
MDDYLSKPVKAADLWAAIDRIAIAPPARLSVPTLIDARVLLAASGDNAENLQEICSEFRAALPIRLSALQQAMRDQDALQLREEAHSLHGMLAVFSTVAGNLASDLEDAAARGQLGSARLLVEQLEAIASELLASLSNVSLRDLRCEADRTDREGIAPASSELTRGARML